MKCVNFLLIGYVVSSMLGLLVGLCSFPVEWDSVWYDSRSGEVIFNQTDGGLSVSGWTIEIKQGLTILGSVTSWECIYGSSDDLMAFRSYNSVFAYTINSWIYICAKLTKVTDQSYYYYLYSDKDAQASDERVKMININQNPTLQELCAYTSGPAIEEFHLLVKQGYEDSAKQYCPPALLGSFNYTYVDGTSEQCGNASQLDVCDDRMTMTFNYTQCNVTQAHSQEGDVYCLVTIANNNLHFLSVLNPGTVDNVTYFRFTCYALQQNDSIVMVSQHPGSCEVGQSPTGQPTGGALLTLVPYSFTTTSSTNVALTSTVISNANMDGQTISLIAGIVLGVTALALGVFSIIVVCKKYNKTSPTKINVSKITQDQDTGVIVPTPKIQDKQKLAPLEKDLVHHLPNGIVQAYRTPLPPISAR